MDKEEQQLEEWAREIIDDLNYAQINKVLTFFSEVRAVAPDSVFKKMVALIRAKDKKQKVYKYCGKVATP